MEVPSVIRHFIERYAVFGANNEMYTHELAKLKVQFGQTASESDVLWSLYNTLLENLSRTPDLQAISFVYSDMAAQRYEEGAKYDGDKWLREANRRELLYLESIGCTEVVICDNLINGCTTCKQIQNINCSIKKAKEVYLMPLETCTCYASVIRHCTCKYIATSFSKRK